jgi:hypothetical protein
MKITTKLIAIAIAVTSLAFAPSIVNIQPVEAASHWCEQQYKGDPDLTQMCQQGWYDHDHCKKYNPAADSKQEASAYKKGWNHGSCK